MRCPFPGMDPYLERPEIWPDFHDSLITYIREVLQPLLRPRYVALTQDRLYVVEAERPIRPDVSVVRPRQDAARQGSGTQPGDVADIPVVVELVRDEIRQPLIHIIEPAGGNRLVTAIEVLSPDNKAPGPGRDSYLEKRQELWQAGANLVELDLLRGGEPLPRVTVERVGDLPARRYFAAVTRCSPPRYEIYPSRLEQRLPRVSLPLSGSDPDVVLDLQAAFERAWDAGPYPELLRYEAGPPGALGPEERAWCEEILRSWRSRA